MGANVEGRTCSSMNLPCIAESSSWTLEASTTPAPKPSRRAWPKAGRGSQRFGDRPTWWRWWSRRSQAGDASGRGSRHVEGTQGLLDAPLLRLEGGRLGEAVSGLARAFAAWARAPELLGGAHMSPIRRASWAHERLEAPDWALQDRPSSSSLVFLGVVRQRLGGKMEEASR